MNLGRIFANAIARRVAYLLVALIVAALASLFGIGEAHAQSCPPTTTQRTHAAGISLTYATAQEALAACNATASPGMTGGTAGWHDRFNAGGCTIVDGANRVAVLWEHIGVWESCSTNYSGAESSKNHSETGWQFTELCENYNSHTGQCDDCPGTGQTPTSPNNLGAYQCSNGCGIFGTMCSGGSGAPANYVCWTQVGGAACDPSDACPAGLIKSPINGVCYPPTECPVGTIKNDAGDCIPPAECPEGEKKNQFGICMPIDNECPAGNIKSPEGNCLPGDGQCSAGQTRGSDGTCKADSDNDGEPDEGEDTGDFSGGDSCDVPPQCSGDNIMCGQARIQWRIDCNTRRNVNISGGQCGSPPLCSGEKCDGMDYAILLTTWRTACALENANGDGDGDGVAGDGPPEAFDVGEHAEQAVDAGAGDSSGGCDTSTGAECGIGDHVVEVGATLDDSGLGFARACPSLPVVSVMGTTLDFNAVAGGKFCDWMQLGGQIVLILAALMSLRILTTGVA